MILKVGDVQITEAQFETYIADLEAQQGPAELSRKKLGENYSSLLMLSQQAEAHNLQKSPQVIRQMEIDRKQILSNAEFARLKKQAQPTDQEISAYYNAHLDDYDIVEMRRLFIWKMGAGSSHEKGLTPQEAKDLAAAIRKATADGSDPQKLIKDPASVVYDAQPLTFQRGELPEKMEDTAFAMRKPGEWVVLDDTPDTLVMLQLVSRGRRDLKDVSPQIEKKLEAQKLREELDALKTKTGIWMDETYFASKAPIPVSNTESDATVGKSTERGER